MMLLMPTAPAAGAVVCVYLPNSIGQLDGQFSGRRASGRFAAAAIDHGGPCLTVLVVLDVSDARLAGIFSVHGRGSATRFRLSGTNSGGAKLLWWERLPRRVRRAEPACGAPPALSRDG